MPSPRFSRAQVKSALPGHVIFLEQLIRNATQHRFDESVVVLGLRAQEAPLGPVFITSAGELEFHQLDVTVTDALEQVFDEHRLADALCELLVPGSRAERLASRTELMTQLRSPAASREAALDEISARL